MRQSQIPLNNNNEQQQQQHRPTGQYSISKQQQILSNMFQLSEDSSSSYEEYCTKLMTDHDLNDRCRRDSLTTHQTVIQPEPAPQSPQLVQYESASSSITHSLIPRRKKKRSAAVKKRRNQKSSLRHRKNCYHYELIRRVNMPIITIKRILDEYQIKYINVNVVRSTLYLGVKNAELQRRYEQLLPDDVFI